MRRKVLLWVWIAFACLTLGFSANQKTLAILDLKNLSPQTGYDFLSSSLAESFVAVFSKNPALKLVERQQLRSVIQEHKLVLTGLVEADVSNSLRIGELVAAQYLLVGSYTVVKDRVEVNARLVDVSSGVILVAEKTQAPLGDQLFAAVQEMAEKMNLTISESAVGYLSLETTPSGAEVRIGNDILGYTPLSRRIVTPGKYELTVTLKGYDVYRSMVTIKTNETTVVRCTLTKQMGEVRPLRSTFGIHFVPLLSYNTYQPFFNAGLIEYLNKGFIFGFEYGGNLIVHTYSTNLPGNKTFEEIRSLYYHRLDLLAKYAFFYQSRYFSPYVGGGIGAIFAIDKGIDFGDVRFYSKILAGVTIFPTSFISPYLELCYFTTTPSVTTIRYRVVNLFGDYNVAEMSVTMRDLSLGVGLQIAY
ncbi:FlgO family outer membrane protein [Thermospira aquatica]|uniref:PEGA domain-containing protein n=1 Tax=Thermospira aquatica TaxID=2828656 RepID=A0AAX3BCV4_9SPIR|nr:FlgO family outer membrane protein [Thermospira aquatica]URA09849.1 PEGA domain-containing protein [Thermospira aquatica]